MSEFDDEEYESFELDGAGRSPEPVKKTTGSGAGLDDDLEDDDDFDERGCIDVSASRQILGESRFHSPPWTRHQNTGAVAAWSEDRRPAP